MSIQPFRVLSLDGGGMRGLYTATYLDYLAQAFAKRRKVDALDIGATFDLIVGTSVGGIIACALAACVPLEDIIELLRKKGSRIFPRKIPKGKMSAMIDCFRRPSALKKGSEALQSTLEQCFSKETLAQVYNRRNIALAIPAVELSMHRSWVFKTPHQESSMHRDDGYSLVDVCLATSAAPIYRSLASIETSDDSPAVKRIFADGGLWANNPVLVGLIEALTIADKDRPIQVFCMGTCPRQAGELVSEKKIHRGLSEWNFGGEIAILAIDAQEFAFDMMAQLLCPHLKQKCEIVRFPSECIPADLMQYLDLDETRQEAIEALIKQAHNDANMTNSRCSNPDDHVGKLISKLFTDMPKLCSPKDSTP